MFVLADTNGSAQAHSAFPSTAPANLPWRAESWRIEREAVRLGHDRAEVTHVLTFNTDDFRRYTEITAIHPGELET